VEVKALIDCVGLGYDLKVNDTVQLNKKLAEKLIRFGYVEEVKTIQKKSKETKVKK
jgi:hypothetical protein